MLAAIDAESNVRLPHSAALVERYGNLVTTPGMTPLTTLLNPLPEAFQTSTVPVLRHVNVISPVAPTNQYADPAAAPNRALVLLGRGQRVMDDAVGLHQYLGAACVFSFHHPARAVAVAGFTTGSSSVKCINVYGSVPVVSTTTWFLPRPTRGAANRMARDLAVGIAAELSRKIAECAVLLGPAVVALRVDIEIADHLAGFEDARIDDALPADLFEFSLSRRASSYWIATAAWRPETAHPAR